MDRGTKKNRRRPALFPSEMWCVYDRVVSGLPRTNNAIEDWHLAFQKTVCFVHQSIYKLIEDLRLEQSNTENVITKSEAWQVVCSRKKNI